MPQFDAAQARANRSYRARSSTRLTCTADHVPPRAAGMPRRFSPAAICLNDAGLTRSGEQAMPAALCALSNADVPRRA